MDKEGVFVYRDGKPVESVGELPDGLLVIYFDNIKCPFCRRFDDVWDRLVKDKELSDACFVRVVCKYFHQDCENGFAARLYKEFNVTRSPTIFLARKKEKVLSYRELLPAEFRYNFNAIKNELTAFVVLGI